VANKRITASATIPCSEKYCLVYNIEIIFSMGRLKISLKKTILHVLELVQPEEKF